jgi:hypothetical protein
MRILSWVPRPLGGSAVLAVLAGCSGGSGYAIAPLGSTNQSVGSERGRSWMEPNAGKGALLYISDASTNDVVVYHYPSGTEAGVLTGFNGPQGECLDKAGDVWIANTGASNLLEYAHGGTAPMATLDDSGQYPVDCAVDKNNGTLAAANIIARTGRHRRGSLSIYPHATGSPTIVTSAHVYLMYALGYDYHDNLFVDGRNPNKQFQFGELAGGSGAIEPITLSGATINFPGGVQFAQGRVNVGDQGGAVIYQATETGTITGSTPLSGSLDCVDFFIDGKTVICPDAGNGSVEFYNYPVGGSPVQIVTGLASPTGAAVSNP